MQSEATAIDWPICTKDHIRRPLLPVVDSVYLKTKDSSFHIGSNRPPPNTNASSWVPSEGEDGDEGE